MDAHREVCELEPVKCEQPGCGKTIPRGEKAAHESTCPHRVVPCGHAGCAGTFPAEEVIEHRNHCEHGIVVCPHGCGGSVKRLEKYEHDRVCPSKMVPCECASLGCDTKVERGQMAAHLAEPGHQERTLQMVLGMKAQLALTVLPGSEALWVIPNISSHIAAQARGVTSGRYALGPFGYQFQLRADFRPDGFQLTCGTQPGPYDSALEWPFSRSFTLNLLGNGGGGLDKTTQLSMPRNANDWRFNQGKTGFGGSILALPGELQSGGYIQNDSLLVKVVFEEVTVLTSSEALWEVRGVTALKASKDEVTSGRYALGPFGHQFQLIADFGDGDSIGLYCGTQPGPYDDALAWPFNRSYRLMLVGRGGSGLDRSVQVLLPASADEADFNKGTDGTCGHSVCTLAELEAGGYIQNDSILVKVVFAAPGEDLESDSNSE
jgi:hypothetical protein